MEENLDQNTQEWFKEGLRFKCTGCGKCCTGAPGYVFLSPRDIDALASHLEMSISDFMKKYTYQVDEKVSLIDRPKSDHCIFLKNNQCSVYEARPSQCRTFPWWVYFLKDKASWQKAKRHCEGIDHPDAQVVPAVEIAVQQLTYSDNLLEQNFSQSLYTTSSEPS